MTDRRFWLADPPLRAKPAELAWLGVASLGVLVGCGDHARTTYSAASRPSATQAVELPPAPEAEAASELPPSQDPCRGRSPCEVIARHPAGRSAAGHAMAVLELALGPGGEDQGFSRACERRDAWLVVEGAGAPPPRLLLESCNDGYGASGVGEDTLEVSDNLFVHTRMGGSSWRWQETSRVRLDPPAVVGEAWGSWWAVSDAHDAESSADYVDFRYQTRLQVPRCNADGELPDGPDREVIEVVSAPVPSVALPTRLVSDPIGDVARMHFAACALRMEHADGAGDLRFAAVIDAPSKTLFVQVEDDAPSAGDRLRLWTAAVAVDAGTHCAERRPSQAFAFDLDGRAVGKAPAGAPTKVEVAPSPDGRRRLYRITLASLPESMTIGYLDADPKEPPVEIASSQVDAHPGDVIGLGRVRPVPEKRARCVLEGEALVPKLADPPPRTQSMVGG
jgi:hypothetical protein